MANLNPCPFCGGVAAQPERFGDSETARFIICKACGANIYRALPGENDAKLIAAWNARVEHAIIQDYINAITAFGTRVREGSNNSWSQGVFDAAELLRQLKNKK